MINGTVNASREATVRVVLVNDAQRREEFEAIIDTGFSGDLTLPKALIASLNLVWLGREQGVLADGSVKLFDVYTGSVLWNGELCAVEIEAVNGQPLLGMKLLQGYSLQIDVITNGAVSINPL